MKEVTLEIQEIIQRIDDVTISLDKAFESGSLDIDGIINELESLKPALTAIGERLNHIDDASNPLKSRIQKTSNHAIHIDVTAGDYR